MHSLCFAILLQHSRDSTCSEGATVEEKALTATAEKKLVKKQVHRDWKCWWAYPMEAPWKAADNQVWPDLSSSDLAGKETDPSSAFTSGRALGTGSWFTPAWVRTELGQELHFCLPVSFWFCHYLKYFGGCEYISHYVCITSFFSLYLWFNNFWICHNQCWKERSWV